MSIDGAGATPTVERVRTAHFTWAHRRQTIDGADALAGIEAEVEALGSAASRWLYALELAGHLPLAEYALLEARLAKLAPQLFHLERISAACRRLRRTAISKA